VTVKLCDNEPVLADCFDAVIAVLHERLPDMGIDLAITATDMPAWGNGQRFTFEGGPQPKRRAFRPTLIPARR
jgi:hypothetical protein